MRDEFRAVQRWSVADAGSFSSAVGEAGPAGRNHAFASGQEAFGVDRLVSEPRGERASDLSALQHFPRHVLSVAEALRRARAESPRGSQSPAATAAAPHVESKACWRSPSTARAVPSLGKRQAGSPAAPRRARSFHLDGRPDYQVSEGPWGPAGTASASDFGKETPVATPLRRQETQAISGPHAR